MLHGWCASWASSDLPSSASQQLLYLSLRLLQPVRHPHLAVHRRRGGQVLLRLRALARATVELAKAEVAVGDEGAHSEFLGQRGGLAVARLGLIGIGWIAARGDLAEEVQRPDLVSSFGPLAGEGEAPLARRDRVVGPGGNEIRLPQMDRRE